LEHLFTLLATQSLVTKWKNIRPNYKTMKNAIALLSLAGLLLVSGCSTVQPSPTLGPTVLTAAVSLGVSFGLEQHPEAAPYVKIAETTICAAAAGTNIAPADIVSALSGAGITNAEAKLIVNGSLAIYNVAYAQYGTNLTKFKPYAQALCDGIRQGLPPGNMTARASKQVLPPHLR
jgi:hypothetical protein